MDSFSLADRLLLEQSRSVAEEEEKFNIYKAPSIILDKHPAIYQWHGQLYHEHRVIKMGDKNYLFRLIDRPDAKLNNSQAIWLYNRLLELAPPMSSRYILVSDRLVWDKQTAELIRVELFDNVVTTKDKTTLELGRREK